MLQVYVVYLIKSLMLVYMVHFLLQDRLATAQKASGRTIIAAEKNLMATAETALATSKSNCLATFEPFFVAIYLF